MVAHARSAADRRWASLVLLLGSITLAIGCNPLTMASFFLLPWLNDKLPPECPLASKDKDKEVAVVLLTSFANLETRPEFQLADNDLNQRLAQQLRKRFEENKEKVTIIPPPRVKGYLATHSDRGPLDRYDLGKHFKADYVVDLEINSIGLFVPGSAQRLVLGTADITVTVLDVNQPRGEGTIFETVYRTEYPDSGPQDAGNGGAGQFRGLFLDRMAKDLTRYFASYPMDEKFGKR